MYVKTQV